MEDPWEPMQNLCKTYRKPIENLSTLTPTDRAAKKCPNSCTITITPKTNINAKIVVIYEIPYVLSTSFITKSRVQSSNSNNSSKLGLFTNLCALHAFSIIIGISVNLILLFKKL